MISQLKEFFKLRSLLGGSIIPLLAFLILGYIQRNVYDWTQLKNAGYERGIEIGGYLIIYIVLYVLSIPFFWLRPQLKVKLYKEGSAESQPEISQVFDIAHRERIADMAIELKFTPNLITRKCIERMDKKDLGIKLVWRPNELFSCESRYKGDKDYSYVGSDSIHIFPFGKMSLHDPNFIKYSFRFALGTTEVVQEMNLKARHLNWKSSLLFGLSNETEFLFEIKDSRPQSAFGTVPSKSDSSLITEDTLESTSKSELQQGTIITAPQPDVVTKRKKALILALVLISCITIAVAVSFYFYHSKASNPLNNRIDSLAVLPFIYERSDSGVSEEAEYLPRGIPESIIESLSKVPSLRTAPFSSTVRYNGPGVDPQTVGRDLKVRAVLMGKIFQTENHSYAVSIELWDTLTNERIDSKTIDYKTSELYVIPARVAQEIIEKLQLGLTAEDIKEVKETFARNTEAFLLYLKGRNLWDKRGEENLKAASEAFKQAAEKDQNYALAYAGLADCYILLGYYSYLRPKDSFPQAEVAALKAIELDPDLAEAHTSLAYITGFYKWDWDGAKKEFEKAIELNPHYTTAHHWYALFLARRGFQSEALDQIHEALAPGDKSLIINRSLGLLYYYGGQYNEAIDQYKKTIEIDPSYPAAHVLLGRTYEQIGRHEEAIEEMNRAETLSPDDPGIIPYIGWVYAVSGNIREAKKRRDQLKQLETRRYVSPFDEAALYIGLKDKEAAFKSLYNAYNEQSDKLVSLKVDPIFKDLRSDARYAKLLKGMNLEP